jgi:metallo-beta-lactamase class B
MYRLIFLLVIFPFILLPAAAADNPRRIIVSENLELIQLSPRSYIHVSWTESSAYGRYGSNGFIYVIGNEAILFDTPVTEAVTAELTNWITGTLKARITAFVANHWHEDCMGGLNVIKGQGIPSYAHEKTIAIAKAKKLPVPERYFTGSLTLRLGKEEVHCRYLGPGHTVDNIVAWFPSERILFAGCMAKEMKSRSLGNIIDADIAGWPSTIKKALDEYPLAEIVIPGHGEPGGRELLKHTLDLLREIKR